MALNLGFDIDEVVTRTCSRIIDMVNEDYDLSISMSTINNSCLETCRYVEDEELNLKIVTDVIRWVNDKDVQLTMEPYEDAIRYIKIFKKQSHKIYFVSARPRENEINTVKWLRKYKLPFDGVYVIGRDPKGELGSKLKLDMFIDDMPKSLDSMYNYKKKWRIGLFLMNRPWNVGPIDTSKYNRVHSFEELNRYMGIRNRLKF